MATATKDKYIEGIGRRKTATARVRLTPAKSSSVIINDKKLEDYFPFAHQRRSIEEVLQNAEAGVGDYEISIHVKGSGLSAQAEAIQLGIARALVKEKAERRTVLKREGYLKRDPRSVERKKFGLKKARKRPTWSKR